MAVGLLGFVVAKANTEPEPSCPEKGKKNDLTGIILHIRKQKTIEGCNCYGLSCFQKRKNCANG